jgi:hypothetical protein
MQEPNTTEEAEAFIPTAVASNDPSLHQYPTEAEGFIPDVVASNAPRLNPNPTFTVPRKAAKRSERWYQPFFTPARKKPRIKEEPLLPPRRSSRRVNAISRTSTAPPPPPPNASVIAASTFRRSPRQTKLPRTETSEAQLDDDDEDANHDDTDDDDDDDEDANHDANVSWPWPSWEDRLRELADYRKIHGHSNVPIKYSENRQLAQWVRTQRRQYISRLEGKRSFITLSRIQALERLDFEWDYRSAAWDESLSELAEYRKVHGHCNVPQRKKNDRIKLASWIGTQRGQYKLHLEGKASNMTLSRIQSLEGLGFEWDTNGAAWNFRFSEFADYHRTHGHCNVPNKNNGLSNWVKKQKPNYRLHQEGKKSPMTPHRIQLLESLGFDTMMLTYQARPGKTV